MAWRTYKNGQKRKHIDHQQNETNRQASRNFQDFKVIQAPGQLIKKR